MDKKTHINYTPIVSGIIKQALKIERVEEYLKRLATHHKDTYAHSVRVGMCSILFARSSEFNQRDLQDIAVYGVLHDMGKLYVPIEILDKNGPLDTRERDIMNQHPRQGFLELSKFGDSLAGLVAVGHHEYKKNSYPRKQRRDDSSVSRISEIVALADICDALVHPRAYKPGMNKSTVERILREQFTGNPQLINLALSHIS